MSDTAHDPRLNAYAHSLIANARLVSQIGAELAAAGVVGIDVYDVLVTLESSPGGRLRLSELADKIVMSRSGLTRRLDRLEKQGLIRREGCSSDRRGSFAVLTEDGREAREAAWPTYREAIRRWFGDKMTEGEARQLTAVMRRVLDGLDKSAAVFLEEEARSG